MGTSQLLSWLTLQSHSSSFMCTLHLVHRNVLHTLICKFISPYFYVQSQCQLNIPTYELLRQKTLKTEILSIKHNVSLTHGTFYTKFVKYLISEQCMYEEQSSSLLAKIYECLYTTLCAKNTQMVKEERHFLMVQHTLLNNPRPV